MTPPASSETILYEKCDGVAIVKLNRPERGNAINAAMSRELPAVWEDIKKDPAVIVAIVSAAGDRAFCTGVEAGVSPPLRLTALRNDCWKPVITAVNGIASAGGLQFIADSDLVLCSENATFFDSHVSDGRVSGLESVALARQVALEAVFRMALLGGLEHLDARRAYEIGLVGEVVPQARLLPRAEELADRIGRHSPSALIRTKRAIWGSLNLGLRDARAHAWSLIRQQGEHPDTREGPTAFTEKRTPRWAPLTGEE